MVPHASAGSSSKHTSLHWEDVKNVTHTKHHVVITSASGSTTRKRRLCVGTSRCRDTFDLIVAHQKMAHELRNRKMIIRPEASSLPRQRVRPMSFNEPDMETATYQLESRSPRPVSDAMSYSKPNMNELHERSTSPPARSMSPVRPANAVRIYVPFGTGNTPVQPKTGDDADVTTRMIQVKIESPVPDLVPMPSSPCSTATTMGSMDRLDLSGPSSPRKSTLVRMGTKITADAFIREKMRLQENSFIGRTTEPSGAYVVGML